jgi:hypothetical protein
MEEQMEEQMEEAAAMIHEEEEIDPALVDELALMGFPEEWCVLALKENDSDLVQASTWVVDNLDMLSSLQLQLPGPRKSKIETRKIEKALDGLYMAPTDRRATGEQERF